MKYEQPYGVLDPNAGYINGNPATGIQGSIPPAAAFEYPMRELVAAITNAGFVPTDNDLAQLTRAIRQGINFLQAVAVGGNPNTLQATSILTLDEYRQGLPLRVLIPLTNTGPTSINIDNLGAAAIIRGNGAQLSAGDLPGGMVAVLVFDGTNFQIENFQGFTSSTTNNNTFNINLPYVADTGTVNNIVANFTPPITGTIVAGGNGGEVLVKLKFGVTGATTILINGMGPFSVYRPNGTPLQNGDCAANQLLWLLFDGVGYQVGGITGSTGPAGAPGLGGPSRILYFSVGSGIITVASSGETRAKVKGWGGGGGGGGSWGPNSGGAGGGGGGYFECLVTNLVPGQQVGWLVGGAGGAGSPSPTGGGTGGATAFGPYATANGGGGGGPGNSTYSVAPGFGGIATLAGGVNGFTLPGNGGGSAAQVSVPSGTGIGVYGGAGGAAFGTSYTDPALSTSAVANIGHNGVNFGGGGEGGGWGAGGGAAAPGFMIVEMMA